MEEMTYKLCFYVPVSHVEQVKQAIFQAGAGHIGDYDCCAFQVLGHGQFRPLDGSQPFLLLHALLRKCLPRLPLLG